MQLEVDEEGGVAGVELSGGVAVLDVVLREDGRSIVKDERGAVGRGPAPRRGRRERLWRRLVEEREESRSAARCLTHGRRAIRA